MRRRHAAFFKRDHHVATSGVEAAATGSEVGDLFEYKIDQPVTVPHDRWL